MALELSHYLDSNIERGDRGSETPLPYQERTKEHQIMIMCRTKEKKFIPSGIDVRNCGKGIAAQSISTLPHPTIRIITLFQADFNIKMM